MAKSKALARRKPFRDPYPRFLIVCEGRVTDKGYFENFRISERCLIQLELSAEGAPITLVRRAVELKKNADRKARKDPNEGFEQVWCVFDIDDHPGVPDAKSQAHANEIHLAISNPNFELWLYLHFDDQRAHIHRDALRLKLKKHLPNYDKAVPFERVHPKYQEALTRAIGLTAWQANRGENEANPSTNVHHLTEKLRAYKT
jgi:hypothetical protein